jgi:hypothetical protein
MDKNSFQFFNLTRKNNTDLDEEKAFQLFSGILSVSCTLPNLISIFIILFQKDMNASYKKIQLILCISFIGIEIKFYPIILTSDKYNIYYFVQYSVCYAFMILSNYYQLLHSYIAYKLFTSPNDLSAKYSKFFLYIFPSMILLFLVVLVFGFYSLTLYFNFIAYPVYYDNGIHLYLIISIIFVIFRATFFALIIFYILKLMKQIKISLQIANNVDKKFADKKYEIYKKKLVGIIIMIFFVLHPYAFKYLLAIFKKVKNPDDVFEDYILSYYFHGIECLSGLLYWFLYIYNKNYLRRLLILFHCKKEEDYLDEFNEEKKIYEESINNILTEQSIDMSIINPLNNASNTSYNYNQYDQKMVDELKVGSFFDDETL